MNTPARTWVRAGLVGVLSLLGLAFTLAEARSQFPRPPVTPPRPPITMPPRPPITMPPPMTPGITGISGIHGGIHGISGSIHGISGMPGGIGGIHGISGGISGISGFSGGIPRTETVWSCSGCGAELGRGSIKPSHSSCPRCQARFTNSVGGGFTTLTPPAMPPSVPPITFTPPGGGFPIPPVTAPPTAPDFTMPGFASPPPATTPVVAVAPATSGDPTGSTERKWKILGLAVLALAIIGATGGALVWNANRAREVHRRRRYVD